MNWTDEPATENQLSHLRQFGYVPDHVLTKGEASRLILDFEERPESQIGDVGAGIRELTKHEAYLLREAVENARRSVSGYKPDQTGCSQPGLEPALSKRREFWLDTCRDPGKMQAASPEVLDLYMKHGCRFLAPTHEQAQEIFDALDSAMPLWDRDHPELFYQTLELNFRELLRHS